LNPKLALAVVLLVLIATFAQNTGGKTQPDEKVWTWKNSEGEVETAEALNRILNEHALWISFHTSRGSPADLKGADLSRAGLNGVNLENANLNSAILGAADLSGAYLAGVDLRGADLRQADLSNANLSEADLSIAGRRGLEIFPARLGHANLSHATLFRANLSNAQLDGANLTNAAELREANLVHANLDRANLSGANLIQANLSNAYLHDAKLDDANFYLTILSGAYYEPKSNPDVTGIAYARDLEFVTYGENSGPLFQLRKQFQDNGFREAERKITYALNRRRAQSDSPAERWFKTIAFDWTCQYGMSPGRALRIWLTLFLLCCIIYAVFIHLPGKSGLYRVAKTQKDEPDEQIVPRQILSRPRWLIPLRLLTCESRVIYWAVFFSLMSAFNIGFRQIDFGRWLRLLPRTEFDLKAKGWMRTIAGFQSLISVYLITLWALSYFGRPFE
jgi:uncharacterized protein YjbI with pentapeptide repeats